MASARSAAPARVACRVHPVGVQEEEHELRGRGESGACRRRRRLAPRAAEAGAVRAEWEGRGGARRDRFGCATLMRRTFDVNVTRCTGCAGRMTMRAVVTDPAFIAPDSTRDTSRRGRPLSGARQAPDLRPATAKYVEEALV